MGNARRIAGRLVRRGYTQDDVGRESDWLVERVMEEPIDAGVTSDGYCANEMEGFLADTLREADPDHSPDSGLVEEAASRAAGIVEDQLFDSGSALRATEGLRRRGPAPRTTGRRNIARGTEG